MLYKHKRLPFRLLLRDWWSLGNINLIKKTKTLDNATEKFSFE